MWKRIEGEKNQFHVGEGMLSTEKEKGEKERGVERGRRQVYTRQKPLWTMDWGARDTECHRFLANSV